MLKLVGENITRNQILASLKASPYKMLTYTKGDKSSFIVEKLGRHHHLNQGIKENISRDGTNRQHMPPGMMH